MAILDIQIETVGQAGTLPTWIYISTNNTVAEVTASGFLNGLIAQGMPLSDSMMALVTTKTNPNAIPVTVSIFDVAKVGDVWSLVPGTGSLGLANGLIFVGNAANIATGVAMSGDATITNAGLLTIANLAITNAKVSATAAIAFSKLAALTATHILVGSVGNVATDVAMSGDATLAATGAITIANNAITTAKILNANVTLAKLAAGITPSHVIKFANQVTTVGGAAAEAFVVTGALAATDRAFVQIVDNGTGNVTALQAVVTNDTLTVTFSGNPGNDTIINYQIIRIAS